MMTLNQPHTSDALQDRLDCVMAFAGRQLERTCGAWPAEHPAPVHTVDGKWYRPKSLWTDWTPGFLAGQLWIVSEWTGDAGWRARAEEYTRGLKPRRFDRDVHDLGFLFLSSWGRWYDALESTDPRRLEIEDVLVTAGTVQSFRYNRVGPDEFIYSFNGPQSLFIDIMMNVRLLFWAAAHGAGDEVKRRAIAHCRTSAKYLVRRGGSELGAEDGSVCHEAIFNTEPSRGEFRCLSTQQGYSPFTCWSRGLAWALYGFSEAYRYTGGQEFLDTAILCADYYRKHTPADGVPFWDYGAPQIPDEPVDSSAAAVAGCGFHILAGLVSDKRAAEAYLDLSLQIAHTLTQKEYLAEEHPGEEGILLHGVYHLPRGWGVDASVMWGEYFFLELLDRLSKGSP